MTLKRTLTRLAILLLLPAVVMAQGAAEKGLVVRSDPQGALVELKGEATVTGITPTIFQYPFVGDYDLVIKQRGYEIYRTKVFLDPARRIELDITLTPKTRFKAAVRSMVFPGWGQRYSDRKGKGLAFLLLSVGASAAYLVADHNFNIKYDRYDQRLNEYDRAVAQGARHDDLVVLSSLLNDAQKDAFDMEDVRRFTIGAAAAVWGLNVLDALLSSPQRGGIVTVNDLTVTPTTDGLTFGLALSHNF
jgi:hypothetical protein